MAKVYHVSSASDATVLVGLEVHLNPNKHSISWFDTTKERIMTIGLLKTNTPEQIIFERAESEGGGEYTFVPMTLEIYRGKVKHKLVAPRDFDTQEALEKAFEETIESAW